MTQDGGRQHDGTRGIGVGRASVGRLITTRRRVIYRKILLWATPSDSDHEFACSRLAFRSGIPTPRPLRRSMENGRCAIDFEVMQGDQMTRTEARPSVDRVVTLLAGLSALVGLETGSRDWSVNRDDYLTALNAALAAVQTASLRDVVTAARESLRTTQPEVFVHGDLGPHNLAVTANAVVCFDFQTASLGPRQWDLAYLCGCLQPCDPWLPELTTLLDSGGRHLALAAAAVKLGRRILRGAPAEGALLRLSSLCRRFGAA